MHSTRRFLLGAVAAIVAVGFAVNLTFASPPDGVSAFVVNRGSFDAFNVSSFPAGAGLFKAQAKGPIDVVIRQHTYLAGGDTGWHRHPYPVLITVKEGTLTFYPYGDPTCTPIVVGPGGGYVDDGRGHIARNEGDVTAVDVSVIMAPVGAAFRSELDAPNPYCGF